MSSTVVRVNVVFTLQRNEDVVEAQNIFKGLYEHPPQIPKETFSDIRAEDLRFVSEINSLVIEVVYESVEDITIKRFIDKNDIDLIESSLCTDYGFEHVDTYITISLFCNGGDAPSIIDNIKCTKTI